MGAGGSNPLSPTSLRSSSFGLASHPPLPAVRRSSAREPRFEPVDDLFRGEAQRFQPARARQQRQAAERSRDQQHVALRFAAIGLLPRRFRQHLEGGDQLSIEQPFGLADAGAGGQRLRGGGNRLGGTEQLQRRSRDGRELAFAIASGGCAAHDAGERGKILSRQRQQQFVFAGEIAIERGGRESRFGRHAAQRQIARAFARGDAPRRFENSGARRAMFARAPFATSGYRRWLAHRPA